MKQKTLLFMSMICALLINCLLFADPVEITYGKHDVWSGEIGQIVDVTFKETYGKTHRDAVISGSLDRVTENYITIGGELIFRADVKEIKNAGPPPDLKPEVDKAPVFKPEGTPSSITPTDPDTDEPDKEGPTHKGWLIPLDGRLGWQLGLDNFTDHDWFSYQILGERIKTAKKTNKDLSKFFVLEVNCDANGDDKNESMERNYICDLIELYRSEMQFISYPHSAMGEAATIVLTCDEIIAAPDSKVGRDDNGASLVAKYQRNSGKHPFVATAFSAGSTVLNKDDLLSSQLSSQSYSQASDIEIGGSSYINWSEKFDKDKKSTLMKASKFLDELVESEEFCVKMFGPMTTTYVGGYMRDVLDAISAWDNTPEASREIERFSKLLRKAIEDAERTSGIELDKKKRWKLDKPSSQWSFHEDVLEYMERLVSFRELVLPGRDTRIIKWPDEGKSARIVERHIRKLKADLMDMWRPTVFRNRNPKP